MVSSDHELDKEEPKGPRRAATVPLHRRHPSRANCSVLTLLYEIRCVYLLSKKHET